MKTRSPWERLVDEPERFAFDAAVRLLLRAAGETDPARVVRFRSPENLAYPPADVLALRTDHKGAAQLTVAVMGLIGPSGVLPRHYTEAVAATQRARSPGLHDFVDLLSHRLVALFARAGIKFRPHRIAETNQLRGDGGDDPVTAALLALTGHGTAHTAARLAAGREPLLHYAGLFAGRPRSAERLQALVSDWLGRTVEVRQFAGAWLFVPPDQRTRLGAGGRAGSFDRLDRDAAIGVRAWDIQAGIVLRIGPLDQAGFAALLPDRPALARLVSLVRAYLGFETGFAINPVLARQAVPPLRLAAGAAPQLGWNTWLTTLPGARRRDGEEPVFDAALVEARMATPAAASA